MLRVMLRVWLPELRHFVRKEAQACLFAGLFFLAVFLVPRGGVPGLPRYDLLLLIALALQWLLWRLGLESADEIKAIAAFHLLGLALELFKTSSAIGSWSYPEAAYTKLFGVPLFSGFMYAAVGSYIGDWRWYLAAGALGLYARSTVVFRPWRRDLCMPLPLALVLIGFFIWLAENLGTFLGLWRYPNQMGAWAAVHVSKWSAWSLLVLMSFTLVAQLKHIKARIHVPSDPAPGWLRASRD